VPKAIILGSEGFLGQNLMRRLPELGWEVHGVGRSVGDLSEPGVADAALSAAPSADRIFHTVTRQRTGQVQYSIQGELLAINARVHLNVLEAWRHRQPQAKLLTMGSSCAYPESHIALTEEMWGTGTLHPSVKGYGIAKQMMAMGAEVYAEQYGLNHLFCVLATMYGPGDNKAPDRSHFAGAMLERAVSDMAAGKSEFLIWGDPGAVRELLYVDDQIDAVLAADSHFENRLLNCAAGVPVTVSEVAQSILDALGWSVPLATQSGSFAGTSFKLLDSRRFLQATKWRPAISLEQGFRQLITAEYLGA
jgi:nucleoside-diphosphate-sugar epimerase